MGSEWEELTLGEFAPFTYGKSLPARKRNEDGEYCVYGSGGISGKHDEPLVNEPGIVIGRKGTVGSIQFSEKPFWPIDTVFYVTDSPERNLHFTYYLLQTLSLDQMNADSAVPGLNRDAAHSVKVRVPPKEKQARIASILKAFDDKIQINKKINRTLEQMAQAMFKSWFVDFDPVFDNLLETYNNNLDKASAYLTQKGAEDLIPKLQQRHQIQQTSDYKPLPEHIKKEFPNDFQHHEDMGWMPEGWEIGRFSHIAKHIKENVKKEEIEPSEVYVGLEHIGRKQLFLTEYGHGNDVTSNKSRFTNGDILFGKLRPYFHKVCLVSLQGICSTDILVFRAKHPYLQSFVLMHAYSKPFVEYANLRSTGTRMPRANVKDMLGYFIIMPSKKLLEAFELKLKSFWFRGSFSSIENEQLDNIRDALVPKLISGKVKL